MNKRSKTYVFTLNNYTNDDVSRLAGLPDGGTVGYICFGKEQGDSGTPHLQGYVEFTSRKTINSAREHLGGRAHVEIRRGSQSEAIQYCRKDGQFSEYGSKAQQGKRTDLETVVSDFKSGTTLQEFALTNPELYCRYRNGLRDIYTFATRRERTPPICIYIFGPPGTGKSKWAHELDPESTWVYGAKGWFDGYVNHRVAVFDDFDCDMDPGLFLKCLDRYPLSVPIKGGFTDWNPDIIVVTSNFSLDMLYSGRLVDPGAIKRRFKHILHFDRLGCVGPSREQLINEENV